MLSEGPPRVLVVTGPFRRTRNPLYLALLLLYTGVVLGVDALGSRTLLLMVPIRRRLKRCSPNMPTMAAARPPLVNAARFSRLARSRHAKAVTPPPCGNVLPPFTDTPPAANCVRAGSPAKNAFAWPLTWWMLPADRPTSGLENQGSSTIDIS